MNLTRRTNRRLHDEHVAVISLLARFQSALQRARDPDALRDDLTARLLREVATAIAGEVRAHFDFEERDLFPRMIDAGESGLVALFLEEHAAINAARDALSPLLAAALAGRLDGAGFAALRARGMDLCERLTAHAEQEEGALLPLLEDLLDDDADRAALDAYDAA